MNKSGHYDYAKVPEHPKANSSGLVLYHRVVMENLLDRILDDEEIVHHKDNDGHNNNPENLELMDRLDHLKMHSEEKKNSVDTTCDYCHKPFSINVSKYKHGKNHFCSKRCAGKYRSECVNYFGGTKD